MRISNMHRQILGLDLLLYDKPTAEILVDGTQPITPADALGVENDWSSDSLLDEVGIHGTYRTNSVAFYEMPNRRVQVKRSVIRKANLFRESQDDILKECLPCLPWVPLD